MEYLVMECGLSYAVVLDSQGRFWKVPNLGYEVGQTLDQVILRQTRTGSRPARKHFARWAAVAACLCVMVVGSWAFWQSPVGTVRMRINPAVQMRVNRFDRVVGLDGLNEDGEDLIDGCRAYGKEIRAVSNELADRAVERGYLRDGGKITLTVESDREEWKTATEELLLVELDIHFDHRVTVETASDDAAEEPDEPSKPADMIVIQPEEVEDDNGGARYEDDDRNDLPDMKHTGEDGRGTSDNDPDDDVRASESDHGGDNGDDGSDDADSDDDDSDSDDDSDNDDDDASDDDDD